MGDDGRFKRIGRDCRAAGIAVYHLIHSSQNGVLGLREEYEDGVTDVCLGNGSDPVDEEA